MGKGKSDCKIMKLELFSFLLVLLLLIGYAESFAQSEITLNTNKDSYMGGNTVAIFGTVEGGTQNDILAIEVKDPSGETMMIRTTQLGPGGSFGFSFKLPTSAQSGNYEIISNIKVGESTFSQSKIVSVSQGTAPISPAFEATQADQNGGGCLIATATFGTELAPQVQMLRELRDNTLLQTSSGSSFMTGFNTFYYTFSPTIADWERQSTVLKEAVMISITPLLASLSILNNVDIDSEEKVLGYGIGVILLNIGMYFGIPVLVIFTLKNKLPRRC